MFLSLHQSKHFALFVSLVCVVWFRFLKLSRILRFVTVVCCHIALSTRLFLSVGQADLGLLNTCAGNLQNSMTQETVSHMQPSLSLILPESPWFFLNLPDLAWSRGPLLLLEKIFSAGLFSGAGLLIPASCLTHNYGDYAQLIQDSPVQKFNLKTLGSPLFHQHASIRTTRRCKFLLNLA